MAQSNRRLSCPAPAKLNLFLLVTGRRPDGYHTLQTLFHFIDRSDELTFGLRSDGRIARMTELVGVAEDDDLTVHAARLLQKEAGCRLGVDIAARKRLPLGGGLGGGSSDAATTLIALNRLWNLRLPRRKLQELALKLGADVPVFVFGRNAFAEGIGELLQPIDLPPAWYLVLVPPVSVSSAEVFADPALTRSTAPVTIRAFSDRCDASGLFGRNDLEAVVCRRYPEVARHLNWLRRFGPGALTGSGACVYCRFDSETSAQSALAQLPAGMQGFVAGGLTHHPLLDWLD
jgi:4-diphosphocytidyl-2-C-methyl-D-erythritol kinase